MPKRKKKRGIIRIDCAIGEERVESLKFKVEREQSTAGTGYRRSGGKKRLTQSSQRRGEGKARGEAG
jgi:hypothetical protein